MRQVKRLAVIGTLLASASVNADVVTAEVVDTMPGKAVVGVTGFLLAGAASGGPAGALIGGALGWILGDQTQEVIGAGATAYRVRKPNGDEITVRSPNKSWSIGDEVLIRGNRLVTVSSSLEVSSR